MASSPSQSDQPRLPESDSQISSLFYDLSQQVQMSMTNMLNVISETEEKAGEVTEEIDKCKNLASEKKQVVEEEMERFQKDVHTVLEMLNNRF